MDAASGLELPEGGRPPSVAFEFPAGNPSSPSGSPSSKVPRRRLAEGKSAHASVEEIEAKLREADIRKHVEHVFSLED